MLKSHNRYEYVPITERQPYEWPNGTRLAIFTAMNLEVFPFGEGMGIDVAAPQPEPDVANFSWRDYGNRVGFWRLLELFDDFDIPVSMFTNTELFEQCPQMIAAIQKRGDEIVGHGRTNAERQGDLNEEDERKFIAEVTDTLRRHLGKPPAGWMGPWVSETHVTPDLLQEAGYKYLLEWCSDDQPIWFRTRSGGRILSLPYPRPTNDMPTMHRYQLSPQQHADIVIDQFDEMLRQSRDTPLVFCLSFHPYFSGQAFRVRQLRRILEHIQAHRDKVWMAHTGQIASHVESLPAGIVPGS